MGERYDFQGNGKWARRDEGAPADADTWLTVDVDMKHPDDPEPLHSHAPKRRVQAVVGGMDTLLEILRGADRMRTFFMKRDLRWANDLLRASGMEIVVVRRASTQEPQSFRQDHI